MRILIVGLNFSPELVGIGKYTGELAQVLAQKGHQVTVVTAPPYYPHWQIQPGYSGGRYQTEIRENLKIIRCPVWVPRRVSGLKRILHLLSFALSSFGVVLCEARFKPDVILAVAPALAAAPAAALAGKRSKALTWLHIQDFEVDTALNLGILKNRSLVRAVTIGFEKWVYRKFDRVSTISQKMVERLAEKGVPQKKTFFFPNWIDTAEIFPLDNANGFRQTLGLDAEDIVVLYSGSMGAKQGLEVVIASARLLHSHSNIHFVLCGEGPAKAVLQSSTDGCSNIHFLPLQPAEKLNELLNMADIHVVPQKRGVADLVMPSKLLGILSSGKPVIAGCLEGSELYRVVNEVGITVAPEDAGALTDAIESLAMNSTYRTLLGKKGREFAAQYFSKAAVVARFISEIDNHILKESISICSSTGMHETSQK